MIRTPLAILVGRAPGIRKHAALSEYFGKHGMPRVTSVFGNLFRGEIKDPSPEFMEMLAEATQLDVEDLNAALKKTLRLREAGRPPFTGKDGRAA